jgi:hypothetical protein
MAIGDESKCFKLDSDIGRKFPMSNHDDTQMIDRPLPINTCCVCVPVS